MQQGRGGFRRVIIESRDIDHDSSLGSARFHMQRYTRCSPFSLALTICANVSICGRVIFCQPVELEPLCAYLIGILSPCPHLVEPSRLATQPPLITPFTFPHSLSGSAP